MPELQRIMKIICTTVPGLGGLSEAESSWVFFRKKGHLGSFEAKPPVCHSWVSQILLRLFPV